VLNSSVRKLQKVSLKKINLLHFNNNVHLLI
jgi:hypothetical protein